MKLAALLAQRQADRAALVARREALGTEGKSILETAEGAERTNLTPEESTRSREILAERAGITEQLTSLDAEIANIQREIDDEAKAQRDAEHSDKTSRAGDKATGWRVGSEPRTYARENDPKGMHFLRDVAQAQVFGSIEARENLQRHMQEERVEREAKGMPLVERAATTGSFAGLVVPQYLTELAATFARAGRPFADAARHHDLPAQGMTVNISKLTTGSTAADQTEGTSVDETDIDDTLLTINVKTSAGSQSVSRQAIERGTGIEDTTVMDLIAANHKNLDSNLLNQGTTGLTNVATGITYTDTNPTAAELYPKLLQGPSAVEEALLDADLGDTIAVMHSRRWFWLQAALGTSFPLLQQANLAAQVGGQDYGVRYGAGFRGMLPGGVPVIVDNNIATNLGAATNQDEIYFVAQSESHLWEDPNAPLLIRAEQTQSKSLLIDFVVYGYYAYTFTRRAHAQKIGGSGLVTPTWA